MCNHMDRKSNEVIFSKCNNPHCKYCSDTPVIAKHAWNYLKENEFKWPNPLPSNEHTGHYMTYIEVGNMDPSMYLTGRST